MSFINGRVIDCHNRISIILSFEKWKEYILIFLFLIGPHLKRLTYKLIAKSVEKMITALIPYFFLSSCSGSAAQLRKVTTSLAIWEVVAGVPKQQGQS